MTLPTIGEGVVYPLSLETVRGCDSTSYSCKVYIKLIVNKRHQLVIRMGGGGELGQIRYKLIFH
jgi:hypothetical protein